jgi:hypothetical protein
MRGARIKNLNRLAHRNVARTTGLGHAIIWASVLPMILYLRTCSAGRTFDVALRFGKDVLNASGGRFSLDVLVTDLVNDG